MVTALEYADKAIETVELVLRNFKVPLYCCVAGGAIRDTYYNNDVKDIDIFINTIDQDIIQQILRLFKAYKQNSIKMGASIGDYGSTEVKIYSIYEVMKEPWPIQLIFTNYVDTRNRSDYCTLVINSFDFSVCCAYRHSGISLFSSEFFEAEDNKQLIQMVVNRTQTSLIKRIKRLRTKFPTFTLKLHPCCSHKETIEEESRP